MPSRAAASGMLHDVRGRQLHALTDGWITRATVRQRTADLADRDSPPHLWPSGTGIESKPRDLDSNRASLDSEMVG